MKKFILSLVMILAIISVSFAQKKTLVLNKYLYYPEKAVYYGTSTGYYFYYDKTDKDWKGVHNLPEGYEVNNTMDRFAIVYKGTAVWNDYKKHKKEFKVKRDGTVKLRPSFSSFSLASL